MSKKTTQAESSSQTPGLAAWGIKSLDFSLDSATVTSITAVAAITIVVAFFLFTRPQKR
tara:strand:- start:2300 stop:2476 length:177 start_codon:yes stop_codon:yes gene_type:complete